MQWAIATAAFLASAVEFVEAFTIVPVVGVTINWRSSLLGAFAAAATLAVIVATLGVALVKWVPINDFRLAVGIILMAAVSQRPHQQVAYSQQPSVQRSLACS
jgi:uncharacterized membrane protein